MATEKESNTPSEKVPVKNQPAHRLKITFDLRFTLRLIAGVAVFGVAVHFLHAYQVDRNADTLRAKSKEAQAEGNLKEATQYLQQYIGFRPQDASAVADLAQLLDQQADSGRSLLRVYFTYQEAVRQDSGRDDLRHRMIEIALLLRRYDDALLQIKNLEKKGTLEIKQVLQAAECRLNNRDIHRAARRYIEAIQRDETQVEAYSRLADLFIRFPDDIPTQEELEKLNAPKELLNVPQELLNVPQELVDLFLSKSLELSNRETTAFKTDRVKLLLARMVNLGEPKYRAYVERALSRTRRDEIATAEEDVAKALELAPNDTDVLMTSVNLNLKKAEIAKEKGIANDVERSLEKAEQYASQGLKLSAPDPQFHFSFYQIQQLRGDLDKAQKALQDGLATVLLQQESANLESRGALRHSEQTFRFSIAHLLISRSALETGQNAIEKINQAQEIVTELRDTAAPGWRILYLEARLHFVRKEWRLAVPKYEQVRLLAEQERQIRRSIDLALGECYRQLSNPDRQIIVFRRALEDDPLWVLARVKLAQALAAANRLDDAIEAYQLTGGVPGAGAELAQLLLIRERRVPKAEQNWQPVRLALQQAEKFALEQNSLVPSQVRILQADVFMQQEKQSEAKAVLEKARIDHPDDASIVNADVELIMSNSILDQQSRIQNAEKLLADAEKELGDRYELRLARARIAQEFPPEKAAKTFSTLAENTDAFSAKQKTQLLQRLAQLYAFIGDMDGAKGIWQRLAQSNDLSISSRLSLFQLATRNKDEKAKRQLLEQIQKVEGPNGPYGNVLQAEQLIMQAAIENGTELSPEQRSLLGEARRLLQRAGSQRTSWSAIPRMLGTIEQALGNEDIAHEQYLQAIEKGDQSKFVIENVVQYLLVKQRLNEASQLIQKITEKRPQLLSGNLARLDWQISWMQDRREEAVGLADAVAENSEDFRDKLMQSNLHFLQGDRGKLAEDPLREATHDFPKEPQVWLALVAFLERVGRREEAIAELKEAEEILPSDPPHIKPITLARGYETVGDLDQAEKYYLLALKTEPDSPNLQYRLVDFYTRYGEYAKANPYIDSLLDPQNKVSEEIQEQVRSRRARIIASSGNYGDIQEAFQALETSSSIATLFDLRTKSLILSTRRTNTDRREHIRVLNQIADKGAIETTERLQLARLYENVGNWQQSRQTFETLLNDLPKAELLMVEFSTALLRHDEIEESRRWLGRAKLLAPDAFSLVLLEARILLNEQKNSEAVAIVDEFIADDDSLTSSPTVLQEMLASNEGKAQIAQFSAILKTVNDEQLAKHFQSGIKFLEVRQAEQAISEFLLLLKNEQIRNSVQAYLSRQASRLFSELGEHDHAEQLLKRSMDLVKQPSDSFELVSILARQNRVSEALDLCDTLWGAFEDSVVARTSIAVLRTGKPNQKEIRRVEAQITAAMAKSSTPGQIALHLADLKDLQGDYPQAVALYEQALRSDELNLVALNNFAYLSILIGNDQKQALDAINRAIETTGPVGAFLDTRGVVHLKSGNFKQAIKDLTFAIDENSSLSTRFRLSQAYWEQGDQEKSREVFKEAQEAGLSIQSVHPLEREEYEQFEKTLETKP